MFILLYNSIPTAPLLQQNRKERHQNYESQCQSIRQTPQLQK